MLDAPILAAMKGSAVCASSPGYPPAPDLADSTKPHQHPLVRVGPIHPPKFHLCRVPAAVDDVGFRDTFRGQHTLSILRIDGKVGARAHLGRRKPAFGFEIGAIEGERLVVVSKAKRHAVDARNPPAPGQCGGAIIQMSLKRRGEGFHLRISRRGMEVIEPRRSTSRMTSSASVSNRTGTSNSNPARMMTPEPGAVVKVTTPVVASSVQPDI